MRQGYTYQQVKYDIEVRELDVIRVMGKKKPVKIYEVLARKRELSDTMGQILPVFNQGLDHYKNKRWKESIEYFEKALDIDEEDGPSLVFFERCISFQKNPPPDDWDGVYAMTSK